MNGGYKMIDKSSNKIYSELVACLTLGKPILWYEDKNTCYFIDTISGGEVTTEIVDDEEVTTYGDIILTKGGKTITITAENVVTEEGEIQPSSGGSTLYQHNITLNAIVGPEESEKSFFLTTSIITNSNTPLTLNTLVGYLHDNEFEYNNGTPKCITASGADCGYVIIGICNYDENDLTKLGICYDDQTYTLQTNYITQQDLDDYNGKFEDTIIQVL